MATFAPANRPYDVLNYKISLDFDPAADPKDFPAEVEIKLKATRPLDALTFDRDELEIHEARMVKPEKTALELDAKNPAAVTVKLPKKMKKNAEMTIAIRYTGKVRSAHYGFFRVVDPDDQKRGPLFFTHFEAMGARCFFPCNDEPYDKATTEIVCGVPATMEALSNGKRVKDERFKKDGKAWRRIHWKLDKPHPTYLVSLAVGPFKKRAVKVGAKEVSVWVGDKKKDKASYSLQITKKCYEFFEKYLGVKYPWHQYATIGLPTYLWGGMENTTSTHMNEERTLLTDPDSEFDKKKIVGLAAHELAHQWFGDYVTMMWWDDLWLNEAFASLLGTRGTAHIFGEEETEIEIVVETWDDYMRQEDGPRSHPIIEALSCPDDAFDAINYTKGENILRMLAFYVGENEFRKGLKLYLRKFALGNATYKDFFRAIEEASGEKLTSFRDSWLLQRGYPVITHSGQWDEKKKKYKLTLEQHSNHASDDSLFTFRMPLAFHRRGEKPFDLDFVVEMKGAKQEATFTLPAEPEWVTINPGGIVLCRVSPRAREEEKIRLQALHDPNGIARVWASYALAEGLTKGGSISDLAEETLLAVVRDDQSPYVRNAVLVAFQRMKARALPQRLAAGVFALAKAGVDENLIKRDGHGWPQFAAELLGALGKVRGNETIDHLAKVLENPKVPLDYLAKATRAVAAQGEARCAPILRGALERNGDRGYPYKFATLFAFGAYEHPSAAEEIRRFTKDCGVDLIGRLGRAVRDNQTLKTSPEWADYLRDLVLKEPRFGEEVKVRILQTIEDVKTPHVERLLQTIAERSEVVRIQDVAKNILAKNFTNKRQGTDAGARGEIGSPRSN